MIPIAITVALPLVICSYYQTCLSIIHFPGCRVLLQLIRRRIYTCEHQSTARSLVPLFSSYNQGFGIAPALPQWPEEEATQWLLDVSASFSTRSLQFLTLNRVVVFFFFFKTSVEHLAGSSVGIQTPLFSAARACSEPIAVSVK